MLSRVGVFFTRVLSLKERILIDASRKLISEGEHKAARILLLDVIEKNPSNKSARQIYVNISMEGENKEVEQIDQKSWYGI